MTEQEIYIAAMNRQDPADRRRFLDDACGGNDVLRNRLEKLIQRSEWVGSFLEHPPQAIGAVAEFSLVMEGPGAQIGGYTIREQIGEGGFAVVYMAEQTEPVRRQVALKIIKLGMDTRQVIARFAAERQALAMMDHPGIADVYDAGATDTGRPYFVMQLIRGIPITEYCDHHRLTTEARLRLVLDVCNAVQHAHQKGIIHRDIKPSNVLVALHDGQPVPKVIDFGVAKAMHQRLTEKTLFTSYRQIIGTPQYMSPEQAEFSDLDVDTRSDIYSLGVLLYELLTGTTPIPSDGLNCMGYDEICRTIRHTDPATPSRRLSTLGDAGEEAAKNRQLDPASLGKLLRGDLDCVVMKCLEKDRSRRYTTANDLALDLRRYLENEPVVARPPSTFYRFQKAFHRNRLAFTAAMVVVATLVVGTGVSTWQAIRATQMEQLASAQAEQLRRKVYAFYISRAADALERDNFVKMREYLDQCPEDLRHWEWRRLNWVVRDTELFALRGTERPLFTIDGQYVLSADFRETRDYGQRGAYGHGDKTNAVVIWDAKSGQRAGHLKGHLAPVASLALSDDNRLLATCDVGGTMILWDLSLGLLRARELRRWKAHHDKSDGLAFSPDGTKVASVGWDGLLMVWDARTASIGELLFSCKTGYRPRGVSFSADGSWLATSGYNGGETRIWNANTGEMLHRLDSDAGASGAVEFSPHEELLAAGAGNDIEIWNTSTWQKIHVLQGHRAQVRAVAFSPQGDRLASCSWDGAVLLWDTATGDFLTTLGRHPDLVEWLSFSPDGQRVASYSPTGIRVWASAFKPDVLTLRGHEIHPHALAISTDQRLLVSAGCDCTVKLWDTRSGIELRTLRSDGQRFWAVSIDVQGELIAAAGEDGTAIFVWQAATGQLVHKLRGHLEPVTSLSFRPGRPELASASEDDTIRRWDLRTGRTTRIFNDHSGNVNSVVYSPDGQRLASASDDGKVLIWQGESDEPVTISDHPTAPETVAFSPNGSQLAVAFKDGTIALYDARSGERLLRTRHGAERTKSMAFSPDARRLFSGGSDGGVRVWDTSDGEQLLTLMGHSREVVGVVVMRDGPAVASASLDGTIKIWEAGPRAIAHAHDREMVEHARRIVDRRYELHGFFADVEASLRTDPSLDTSMQSVALQIANARGERAWRLWESSLDVAREPNQDLAAYQLAVRQAEAACSASPDSWRFLPTLGMALYRVGEYERALEVLRRAETISNHTFGTCDPTILSFSAMALHRMGKSDAAREALEKAIANNKDNRWSRRANLEAFLAEAQQVINESPHSDSVTNR